MGRRALPKVDHRIDLSRYLYALDDLPVPWARNSLFEDEQPLEIEVGSGKGLFMATRPRVVTEHNFLGIEVSRSYARYAATRVARTGQTNAVMVHGDAQRLFTEYLPDGVGAAIHVYFPDPWWKKRHRKRRIMNREFLRQADRVLRVGGTFHFWTDVEEYFHTALEQVRQVVDWTLCDEPTERPAEHDLDYQTHFERRMRQHGLSVYRSLLRKSEDTSGA